MKPYVLKNNSHMMIEEETNGVPLLMYPKLKEITGIQHCFTTREGGVSQGIFESMNLSFTRGDEKEAVLENFHRIADVFELPTSRFVFTDQTHTTNIRRVNEQDAGKGLTRERDYTDVDGLVTNTKDLVLSAFFADCVPLYFVDPINKAIGLAHSGWRGTVGRIGEKMVRRMEQEFGSKRETLMTAIGPSICQECYEISQDVAEKFQREFFEHKAEILQEKGNGKYLLDLWKTNEIILREAGVLPEHILTTDRCTCCNPTRLFSHRASKGKRGNLAAFLCLKIQ